MRATMRGKSGRKPLKDLSNNNNGGRTSSKSITTTKRTETDDRSKVEEQDDALDRLLLVQSDLSSLIHQIDELVVQAFKLKKVGKHGKKEIESFTRVLSDMISSLKPWFPRFQKVLSHPSMDSSDHVETSLASKSDSAANEMENSAIDSPENAEVQGLISPSPLVSWRAGCNIERGRQLFLLTPLPISKSLSSKPVEFSKSIFDRVTSGKVDAAQSCFISCGDSNVNLLEGNGTEPEGEISHERGFVSPPMSSKKTCSVIFMTPCLKMSPPKSCVLLEPISEASHRDEKKLHKATPYPVGVHYSSSDSDASDGLALKYPELLGIQPAPKSGLRKKDFEASPDWLMSPPKTCVLLEPSDSPSADDTAGEIDLPVIAQVPISQLKFSASNGVNGGDGYHQTKKSCNYQDPVGASTPMWNACESVIQVGKRAGEETLKRELWVKFEEASANPFHCNKAPQRTSKKVFMDLLDEASCDEVLL